ncbi:MAG: acetate kinase [Ruminococcaceae bacterium]|nr:acetate kinase [Oscillospiraceae bacterium]
MNILVINCGSSSLKYQLIDTDTEKVLAKGLCERIGINDSVLNHTPNGGEKVVIKVDMPNHKTAIEQVIKALTDKEIGVIGSLEEIAAIGHRVVHGGEKFASSVPITDEVMKALDECTPLAPLHNPPNIIGINACTEAMPGVPQVGVFDTAYHQTMPKHAYMYALPYEYYEKYGIRKYGFHGTSHKFVAEQAAKMLNKPLEELKIITCHVGSGASIAAIKYGKSVDTTMGFTPLDGLVMGTRCGTIDPAVPLFIMDQENLTTDQMSAIMNKKSGVLGISGVSADTRDVWAAAKAGDEKAILARDMFFYRIRGYIGRYIAAMNGADAIVFTAGVGENDVGSRALMCQDLDFLGIKMDPEKNEAARAIEYDISAEDSKIKLLVVPTNEELAIARETLKLIKK